MNAISLYVGPGNVALCERAAHMLKGGATFAAVATELHCSRSTVRKMARAHDRMAHYTVTLERDDMSPITLGDITTPNGIRAAALAMARHHRTMLNRLEIPGWAVCLGGARIDLNTLRDEMKSRKEAA